MCGVYEQTTAYLHSLWEVLQINLKMNEMGGGGGACGILPSTLGQKKNLLCCPHPTKIWKLGRSVDFFIYFFFLTYRERVEFSNIFLKVSKWGKLGRNAVKTHIYTSAFLSHWIQIVANSSPKSDIFQKKKKKNLTLFFRILRSVGRGQHNKFFFGLTGPVLLWLSFEVLYNFWCNCVKLGCTVPKFCNVM